MSTERDLNEAQDGGSGLNVELDDVPIWWTCKTHGDAMPKNAWGCPECVKELRSENARLRLAIEKTINENMHLADGDNCTLIDLKRAIETPNTKLTFPTGRLIRRYMAEELKKWWPAKCPKCGWRGLSRDASGGHGIADTGDFSDVICPECKKHGWSVDVVDDNDA